MSCVNKYSTSLTKVLLAQLLSLVRRPAWGRVWVVPYSLHFLMMEFSVLLGTFNTLEIVLYPSLNRCLITILSQFYGQFLGLHGRVSALTCTVNCGTSCRKVCFFINVQSIELSTGGLNWSYRDILRMIKGNWMHMSFIWSVIANGLNTYWHKTFQLFIFN